MIDHRVDKVLPTTLKEVEVSNELNINELIVRPSESGRVDKACET